MVFAFSQLKPKDDSMEPLDLSLFYLHVAIAICNKCIKLKARCN